MKKKTATTELSYADYDTGYPPTPENLYTVQETAERLGMTDGRVYQLIKDGMQLGYPEEGKDAGNWIKPASDEYLVKMGLNPALLRKPKWWITESEIEPFANPKRRSDAIHRDEYNELAVQKPTLICAMSPNCVTL